MSNRKYRLLKDLPDAKRGDIYAFDDTFRMYWNYTRAASRWSEEYVHGNPEWFEEIKEPEVPSRIEVQFFPYGTDAFNGMYVHSVAIGKQITREDAPAISRAIEAVVNGDMNDELISLLTACVSETWGNPSLGETQKLYNKFLEKKGLIKPNLNETITRLVNEILLGKRQFQWTDELVKEFVEFHWRTIGQYNKILEEFKKSKQKQ